MLAAMALLHTADYWDQEKGATPRSLKDSIIPGLIKNVQDLRLLEM
jgi:hypothetical protein